ncbi:MAG: hypothetical protein IJ548_01160 [Paludibacteraceae bacterium]|nr:hypothetical protein [Paludibacteraceae bacterium]MBQ9296442.1 hypothetical protein [Paludibacteraceae bacterium]
MENQKNNNPSAQESSSVSQLRHEAAKDYTRELVEEIVSSTRSSSDKKNKQ